MWKIERRDHKIKQWEDLGNVVDLKAAAVFILKEEFDQSGALFFACYVDPHTDFAGKDDAELLARFEYRTAQWLYTITRQLH